MLCEFLSMTDHEKALERHFYVVVFISVCFANTLRNGNYLNWFEFWSGSLLPSKTLKQNTETTIWKY